MSVFEHYTALKRRTKHPLGPFVKYRDEVDDQWHLKITNGLILIRPTGAKVSIPRGKLTSVLAAVALSDTAGIDRHLLATLIWPNAASNDAATSLRQALKNLRRILDGCVLMCSRTRCWIDWNNVYCEDRNDRTKRNQWVPECAEPWFSQLRGEPAPPTKAADSFDKNLGEIIRAANAFETVLKWAAISHPRGVLEMMRACPELVQTLPPASIHDLVEGVTPRITTSDPILGWSQYFHALALMYQGLFEPAMKDFGFALDRAVKNEDMELLFNVAFYRCGILVLQGKPKRAIRELNSLAPLRTRSKEYLPTVRFLHGLGLAHVHAGKFRQGVQLLEEACNAFPSHEGGFEKAYALINTAWMAATTGQLSIAQQRLVDFDALESSKSWRLAITRLLTEAVLHLHHNELDPSTRLAQHVIELCGRSGVFDYYAFEILASVAARKGKRERAQDWLARADEARDIGKIRQTAWDVHRRRVAAEFIAAT